jgi:hypothetical protein
MRLERSRATSLAWLIGCAGACGGSGPVPDAASGHDLTISLFRHVPFVDGDTEAAPLVAVQDGDGPWTAIESDHGVYRVHLASDRHGVAIACRVGASSFVELRQRVAADGLELRERACAPDPIELDVWVRNVPAGSFAYISTAGQAISGGGDATYAFRAQPGATDLFASLVDGTGRMSRLVRMPTFDLTSTKTIAIDFAIQGVAPDDRRLVLAGADPARVTTSVIRPTGNYALSAGAAAGAPPTYQMLPPALQLPGDLFEVTVAIGSRSASITRAAPDTLTIDLPGEVSARAPAVVIAPVLHPVFSFATTTSDLPLQRYLLQVRTSRGPDDVYREWRADLSAAWIAGAASVQYAFPDLSLALTQALARPSAQPGSPSDFLLFDRAPVRWAVWRTETSHAVATDGRITRSASQSGSVETYCGDGIVTPPETCDPPDASCSETCAKL